MNPLKAHVYLSWGVPVVSTAVANVDADGELVRMAVSHGAFLHQVETTLAAPPPDPGRFRDHVAANGWRARLEPHVEIGRASCRERVCQYVSISVVAV